MIVCIDCLKLFQTISNENKTCNGPGSQSESENRTWHHAQTSRRKNVFYKLLESIINQYPCKNRRKKAFHLSYKTSIKSSVSHLIVQQTEVYLFCYWLGEYLTSLQVLVNACVFVDMKFIRGLPRIKFHINKNKGVN